MTVPNQLPPRVWMVVLIWLSLVAGGSYGWAQAQTDFVDLAHAYSALEQVLTDTRALSDEQVRLLQKGMDDAAREFFGQDYAAAVQFLNSLRLQLISDKDVTISRRAMAALQVAAEPTDLRLDRPTESRLWLRSLYVPKLDQPLALRLKLALVPRQGGSRLEQSVECTWQPGQPLRTELATKAILAAGEGSYDCLLIGDGDFHWDAGAVTVLGADWQATALSYRRQLDSIAEARAESARPAVARSERGSSWDRLLAICRSRIELIEAPGSEARITRWILDPLVLKRQIAQELEALRQGQNPYTGLRGDHWLPLPTSLGTIPCRIYVPNGSERGDTPPASRGKSWRSGAARPLLVVLHGAGGNEHMFFEGLGGGRIKKLADDLGCIVICPSTSRIMLQPLQFPAFLDQLQELVAFDRSHVHLLGHSMGAMAAMQLSTLHPDRIRRTCAIAGGPQAAVLAERLPPTRVYAAGNDFLIPVDALRVPTERLARRGLPVTFHEIQGAGHVFVVTTVLDEATRWLLE